MNLRPLMIVLAACIALPAGAAEKNPPKLKFDTILPEVRLPAYKDLPGVKTPEELEASRADGFTCTTALRSYRNDDPRAGFRRTLPRQVYRCEKNGIVVESRELPARGAWMPGINPSDARMD
ncbi:hypothetical protein NOF55_01085 [Rhizobiaceae bacterium BDR2-2]|uniref:Uncharacterized protein n=1 Tax=Ectorhizobium quercum TaxID=2965071 RepID=A0AAE3MWN1_9HYPH|nr:hypothetical protein [Ectorhizobium quercum]MCX8995697.1 hypothetical protein [Ectorhizobium quercum]